MLWTESSQLDNKLVSPSLVRWGPPEIVQIIVKY